jgi:1-carboxybiuret hydrolase subunit AtzG-like protein
MDEAERTSLLSGAAALLDLRIDPAMQPGIVENLALLQQHAARILFFPLPAEEEIAPVFHP